MDLNGNQLNIILGFLGMKNVRAHTETPSAAITIQFDRYGQTESITFTLGELIQELAAPESSPTEAPPGYTDIRTLQGPSSQ